MKSPKFFKSAKARLLFFGSILMCCVIGVIYFSINDDNYVKTLLDNYFQPNISKVLLVAIPAIVAILIIGLSNEIFSGDLHERLKGEDNLYEWLKGEDKKNEVSSEDIESDLKLFYNSLKERYQKHFDSKLEGSIALSLRVIEDGGLNISTPYEFDAKVGNAVETVKKAFVEKGRLLIVGSPGSGKTVLLLKLALELLGDVYQKDQKIPVIFNLASWSQDFEMFDEWVIDVLNKENGLSGSFARNLLQQNRIAFLLDGLDEMRLNQISSVNNQSKFLKSLNNYLALNQKVVISGRIYQLQNINIKNLRNFAVFNLLALTKADVILALLEAQNNVQTRASAKHLLELIEANDIFLNILKTPYLIHLALKSFNEKDFPTNQSEINSLLYDELLKKIIKQIIVNLQNSQIKTYSSNEILEEMALKFFGSPLNESQETTSFRDSNIQEQLAKYQHLIVDDDNRRVGDTLNDQYKLEGFVGSGGMGWVYLGSSVTKNEVYAIKLLKPDVVKRNPRNIKLFEREVEASKKLNHPNIVQVYDSGTDENHRISYMVMEVLDGITVEKSITNKKLPIGLAKKIFRQTCEAIQYAHSQSVLHLDLKPLNIMLLKRGDDYDVKVIDFGMAKIISSESGTTVTQFGGTFLYCSPEHFNGKLTYRSDIYCLGATLYFLLTGVAPFGGSYINAKMNPNLEMPPIPSLVYQVPSLPKELDRVIEKAMEREPLNRHSSVQELLADFESVFV